MSGAAVMRQGACPRQATYRIAATPNGSYWARRHTERLLTQWDQVPLIPRAQLLVTELVSAAIRLTSTMDAETQAQYVRDPASVSGSVLAQAGVVGLRLSLDHTRLLVEVWDPSDQPPVPHSGYGDVPASFCVRQGWYHSAAGGRVVWAEIAVEA